MKLCKAFPFLLMTLLFGCKPDSKTVVPSIDKPLITYVNPFVGTGGHGHTYPGATMPFGMMQLSPDTRLEGWDGCSGYHYSDEYIYGFSHTHLSGTGVSDYGDILIMPTNRVEFNNGYDGNPGYRAHFSHDNEIAEPGYYSVKLDSTDIKVELTVSQRSGIHKYAFAEGSEQVIIIDLEHRDEVIDSKLTQHDDYHLSGYRHSKAWAEDQRLFFDLELSRPVKEIRFYGDKQEGKSVKAALIFDNKESQALEIRIGISAADTDGARKNRETELGKADFDSIKRKAQDAWEKQLGKIQVESDSDEILHNFYTSLYHTMLAPNLYQDVDGRYRGMDLEIHQTDEFSYYTVFSLWDTYRAAHPLYTLIERERTNDFINTFLAKYDEGGIMPIWDLSGCYTGCMIGYHAVPVIADAYLKGIADYDVDKALEAMMHSASRDHLGLESYKKFGFIPVELESESVSKTLEYAYDDWTIAQMAKKMGKKTVYREYLGRAQYYKNLYDPQSGFMRGRFRNSWFSPFDPYEVNFNYTEANAWQYSFYVPQDISGFAQLLGGFDKLEKKLDDLFEAESETSGRNQADITGLIGQYAHGNEPSHHMAYLYNFTGKPYKTQERVHEILTTLYSNTPDGISGNEDCGQMSAWYVFSAMGFYPVTPGSGQYIIGTPVVNEATINFESGENFAIQVSNPGKENIYIASVSLNGNRIDRSYLNHDEIIQGGELVFEMSATPTNWATEKTSWPVTQIAEYEIVPMPFIAEGDIAFKGKTDVKLAHVEQDADIFYKLGDGQFDRYNVPFSITEPGELTVYAEKNGKRSAEYTTAFYKIDPNRSISLETEYANQYNAGGDNALIDGIKGTLDFRTGTWQGYWNEDVIATVDLGSLKSVNEIEVGFLQDQRSWIFYPTRVEVLISSDGKSFKAVDNKELNVGNPQDEANIMNLVFELNQNCRFIKVIAKKLGDLPDWHIGARHDGKSWIFIDEITIK